MTLPAILRSIGAPAAAGFLLMCGPAFSQGVELDVPFVPTPPDVVARMLDMVDVQKGERTIDLGSGDGRIAIAAAKRGAEAYGVDIDPVRVAEANENAKKEGVEGQVRFEVKNLFDTNLADFDVITMYLLPSVNRDLRSTILDLKPGTRVVSHAFDMGDWEPDERADVDGRSVFFWRVPAQVQGNWTIEQGGASTLVQLTQTYQQLQGTATVNGATTPVTGTVDGANVRIVVGSGETQKVLNGRVDGEALEAVAGEGAAEKWTARRG
jgi:SAM-dependent methyltransferase